MAALTIEELKDRFRVMNCGKGFPMLAFCRRGLVCALPVVSCGVIAWTVYNCLRKPSPRPQRSSDYERLRRCYDTLPSVN